MSYAHARVPDYQRYMNPGLISLHSITALIVTISWLILAYLFLFRKKYRNATPLKRSPGSLSGVLLVGIGYAFVWLIRRPMFTPFFDLGMIVDEMIAIAAILMCFASVFLIYCALRDLGRHWNIMAQLIDDHQLVTGGIYSLVRHPIYTATMSMLLATGFAISTPLWTLIALTVAWSGTLLRIQKEEALLTEAFGEKYDVYRREVPRLIPAANRRHER